jgi:hypothetical protein
VNCQRSDRRAVSREYESLETATDVTEDWAVIRSVNGRVRNWSVLGGGAMVGIVAVNRLRARAPRNALAFLCTFATLR